jgi:hypothetical protein
MGDRAAARDRYAVNVHRTGNGDIAELLASHGGGKSDRDEKSESERA